VDFLDVNIFGFHVREKFIVGTLNVIQNQASRGINEQANEFDIVRSVAVQTAIRGPVLGSTGFGTLDVIMNDRVAILDEISWWSQGPTTAFVRDKEAKGTVGI